MSFLMSRDRGGGTINKEGLELFQLQDINTFNGTDVVQILRFDVSTKYDLSTAQYPALKCPFDGSSNGLLAIAWGDSGNKFYSSGQDDIVRQYSASTSYKLATASQTKQADLGADTGGSVNSIFWKSDGTKFYIAENGNNTIKQYSASTAWDITTLSNEKSIFANDSSIQGIYFKPDGAKMFTGGNGNEIITQWSLSTPWDIGSATADKTINSQGSFRGIVMSSTGDKLYESLYSSGQAAIASYDLSTTWDIGTSTYNTTVNTIGADNQDIRINSNDDILYDIEFSYAYSHEYELSNPNDLSTISHPSHDVTGEDTNVSGVALKPDGEKMYTMGQDNENIIEYNMSQAYDPDSASLSKTVNTATTGVPKELDFNGDGTKIYELIDNTIYKNDLSTAYDTSTKSNQITKTADDGNDVVSFTWGDSGNKFYEISGGTSNNIKEFDASTPYDISALTLVNTINTENGTKQGIAFNSDGTKLYELTEEKIYEHTLSTAWDTSTKTDSTNIDAINNGKGITWREQ